jgi:hypothetical protein
LKEMGGDFEAPRRLSTRHGQQAGSFPSLSLGASGHVYVVWQHQPSANEGPRGLAFSLSRDGGDRLTSPVLISSTMDAALGVNGSRQGKLMRLVDTNDSGAIAVVHSSFREGESSRIRLILGRASAH